MEAEVEGGRESERESRSKAETWVKIQFRERESE